MVRPAAKTDADSPAAASGPTLEEQVAAAIRSANTMYPGATVRAVCFDMEGVPELLRLPLMPYQQQRDDDGLTARQRKMIDTLRASPVPLTQKALAMRVNPNGSATTGGTYGEEFRELVLSGKIRQRLDQFTDDESKFG